MRLFVFFFTDRQMNCCIIVSKIGVERGGETADLQIFSMRVSFLIGKVQQGLNLRVGNVVLFNMDDKFQTANTFMDEFAIVNWYF